MAETEEDMRTLLVETQEGKVKITIPASCKVTYGNFTPGAPEGGGYPGGNPATLRIWDTKDRQRAVFRGVLSFRDMSLKIERMMPSGEPGQEPEWVDETDGYVRPPKGVPLVEPSDLPWTKNVRAI